MAVWRENISTCSLDDVVQAVAENRAWSKELRERTNSLVNRRLAKQISQAEYALSRKAAGEEFAECQRRELILRARLDSAALSKRYLS